MAKMNEILRNGSSKCGLFDKFMKNLGSAETFRVSHIDLES